MSGMLGEASSLEDGKGAGVVPGARPPRACRRVPAAPRVCECRAPCVWAGCDVILSDTAAAVPFVHTASALLALHPSPEQRFTITLSLPGFLGATWAAGAHSPLSPTRQGWSPRGFQEAELGAQDSSSEPGSPPGSSGFWFC